MACQMEEKKKVFLPTAIDRNTLMVIVTQCFILSATNIKNPKKTFFPIT